MQISHDDGPGDFHWPAVFDPVAPAARGWAVWSFGERNNFSFWDSLIIAAALESHCTMLYTEDLQYGQVIDGRLTIVNPFLPDGSP